MTAKGTLRCPPSKSRASSKGTARPQKTRSASGGTSARRVPDSGTRPPSYVNVPTSVAYAPVPGALVVTMVCILGICWRNGYRRTPPLTLEQFARLLDRPRSTLHRHLDILEHKLGWLRRQSGHCAPRQERSFAAECLASFIQHSMRKRIWKNLQHVPVTI